MAHAPQEMNGSDLLLQEACERRKRRELELDDALENTFPASDPVSIEQPVPPALPRDNG